MVCHACRAHWRLAVTKTDINGTAVIILGVILILVFSSINHGLSQGLNIQRYLVPLPPSLLS
jgi:hypothetical protein